MASSTIASMGGSLPRLGITPASPLSWPSSSPSNCCPPRQRAVLLLRDVLACRAGEVAEILDMTEDTVTSALRRAASSTIRDQIPSHSQEPAPSGPAHWPSASSSLDSLRRSRPATSTAVVALLTEDATFNMPPEPLEYVGHSAVARILANRFAWRGEARLRLIPTRANAQPAFRLLHPRSSQTDRTCARTARSHSQGHPDLGDQPASSDNSVMPLFGLPRDVARLAHV